nr:patatin-like phospholipase family protein [Methylomonas rhizoryzae]
MIETERILAASAAFRGLHPDLLTFLAASAHYHRSDYETPLFAPGDPAGGLYCLGNGQVTLFNARDSVTIEQPLARLDSLFGEFPPGPNPCHRYGANVVANSAWLYWPGDACLAALSYEASLELAGYDCLTTRLIRCRMAVTMRLCGAFSGLASPVAQDLSEQLALKFVPARQDVNRLLSAEQPAFYIVVAGCLTLKTANAGSRPTYRLEPGGLVGANDYMPYPDQAALQTNRDSLLAYLPIDRLENLLLRHPVALNRFLLAKLNRLEPAASPVPEDRKAVIALINLSDAVNTGLFVSQLSDALRTQGATETIDRAHLQQNNAACAATDAEDAMLADYLAAREHTNRFLLLIAGTVFDAWSRRCMRHADHIVLVVAAGDCKQVSALEAQIDTYLQEQQLRPRLVIHHLADTVSIEHSADWLKLRKVEAHYHVRSANTEDFARLGRLLSGSAYGLVLSGGGARGFAHAGVLKAMRQKAVPVDYIAGNSMGALVAAHYAMRQNPTDLLNALLELCLTRDSLTLPLVSLFSGTRITAALQALFKQVEIEDLWLPFFCVAGNLSDASLEVFESGRLTPALLASNSPPGLFPPQMIAGNILVDGALLNNLPIDEMRRRLPHGRIIAVDVDPLEPLKADADLLGGFSGWQWLRNRFNPINSPTSHPPSLMELLKRVWKLAALAAKMRNPNHTADLLLRPPVAEFAVTAYAKAHIIADIGYRYALTLLEQPSPGNALLQPNAVPGDKPAQDLVDKL